MKQYKINLTAKEIGIIQSALEHIEGIVWTEGIKENMTKQFSEQLKKE